MAEDFSLLKLKSPKSQPWQRTLRLRDKFIVRRETGEVLWGEVIDPQELSPYILSYSEQTLAFIIKLFDLLDSEPDCRLCNIYSGLLPGKSMITVVHVGLVEMIIPAKVWAVAKKNKWPTDPLDVIKLMAPFIPYHPETARC